MSGYFGNRRVIRRGMVLSPKKSLSQSMRAGLSVESVPANQIRANSLDVLSVEQA